MSTLEFDFKHLADAPGPDPNIDPGKLQPSDLNNHMLPAGLSANDYWFLMALSTSTRRMVLSNDGRALVNAPLRWSLVGSSAAVSNTIVSTSFNKTLTLPVGALASGSTTTGTVMRLTAGGPITTKAAAPGGIVLQLSVNDGTNIVVVAEIFTAGLIAGMTSGHLRRWSLSGTMTVRAASVAPCMTGVVVPFDTTTSPMLMSAYGTAFNTNLAPIVGAAVAWSTADVDNSITLDTLFAEIMLAGGTTS